MRKKISLILTIFIINSFYSYSFTSNIQDTIIIGGEKDYPPFEFIDEQGEYRGFNVDLMNALSIEMGTDIKLEPMDWVDSQVALQNGKIDAISGMNYNEAREELYEFSNEYLINSLALFVLEEDDTIYDIEYLKGRRVAVQRSDFAAYVLADIGEIELVFFSGLSEAFTTLLNNNVDAVFGNKLTGRYIIRDEGLTDKVKTVGNEYNFSSYGMAFHKDDSSLTEKFNTALESLKQTGTYNKIYAKWFGDDIEKDYSRLIQIIYAVIIVLALITIIIVKINRTLKKQVERRTIELTEVNKDLVESKELIVESNNHKEQILNGIANGLITFNEHTVITTLNRSCEKLLSINAVDYIGKPIDEVNLDPYFDVRLIKDCIEKGKTFDFHEKKFYRENKEITISYILRPLFDLKDKKIGAVMTFNNITELNNLRKQLAETEKMKSMGTMISGISHEIRNPLTTIKTYINLLPLKYDNLSFRNKITEQVPIEISRLNRLLEDLINLTRPKKFKKEVFDLIQVINHAIDIYSIEMDKQNIGYNYLEENPVKVYGDKQQIIQILINLILNAIEAIGENGTINFATFISENKCKLTIKDDGIGITEEHLQKIFDPFFTTKEKGTGLGMAMCYKYAEENSIQMKVDSHYGKGTMVELVFNLHI